MTTGASEGIKQVALVCGKEALSDLFLFGTDFLLLLAWHDSGPHSQRTSSRASGFEQSRPLKYTIPFKVKPKLAPFASDICSVL